MTDNRTQGQIDEVKGKVKEGVGKIAGDRSTEVSGKVDQVKGQAERKIADMGDSEREFGVRPGPVVISGNQGATQARERAGGRSPRAAIARATS